MNEPFPLSARTSRTARSGPIMATAANSLIPSAAMPAVEHITSLDRALFKSVDHALRFAYSIEDYPAYPLSQLAMALRIPGKIDMTPLDWHAQGALIRVRVRHLLPVTELAYIECWYGNRDEYQDGIHDVVDFATRKVVTSGSVKRRLILELVKRYFLTSAKSRPTFTNIAERVDVNLKTVEKYAVRIHDCLNALSLRAESLLANDFANSGLI